MESQVSEHADLPNAELEWSKGPGEWETCILYDHDDRVLGDW